MAYNNPDAPFFRPPPETFAMFADLAEDEDQDEGEIIRSNPALKLTPQLHCRRNYTSKSARVKCTATNALVLPTRTSTTTTANYPPCATRPKTADLERPNPAPTEKRSAMAPGNV